MRIKTASCSASRNPDNKLSGPPEMYRRQEVDGYELTRCNEVREFLRQAATTAALINGAGRWLTLPENLLQQPILRAGHLLCGGGGGVIVPGEMEEAVERVEKHFLFNVEAMGGSLVTRDGGADNDFAVGKGDDVGLRRIAEEVGMDAGDGGAVDEDDFDRLNFRREGTG